MSFHLTFDHFMQTYYLSLGAACRKESQRPGQYFMNCLHKERPDIEEMIRHSNVDCFYLDALLHSAIEVARSNWGSITVNTSKEK